MRILLAIAKLHNLHTKSIDFVQAYPQVTLKSNIYLHPPAGVLLTDGNGNMVLKLMRNLYGLKDAGKTWFAHLTEGLNIMGFKLLSSDPCIYVKGTNMIVLYADNCIIISRNEKEANEMFQELDKREYKLTDESTMEEYLGILITHEMNGNYRMSQPLLIDRIIKSVPSMKVVKGAKTPAVAGNVLTKDIEGEIRKEHWNYISVIGNAKFPGKLYSPRNGICGASMC